MTSSVAIFVTLFGLLLVVMGLSIGATVAQHYLPGRHRTALSQHPVEGDHWQLYGVGRVQVREVMVEEGKVCLVPSDEPYRAYWMSLDEFMDKATPDLRSHQSTRRLDRVARMRSRQ